jgi:hypothetical protein
MRSRLAICVLTFLLIAPPLLAQQPGLVTTTARRLASDVDLTVGLTTGGKNVYVYATEGSELAPALTAGNWTVGAGWESPIVGPGLIKNADGTGTQTPSAATTIVAGTTYKVVITLSAWSVGSLLPRPHIRTTSQQAPRAS